MTYLVSHLDQLGSGTDGSTGDDAAILLDLRSLNHRHIELPIWLVLGVVAIYKVDGEHGQMLVEEVDAALVDALGDILADLVRRPSLDHVEGSPAVLGLGTGRGADEEAVLELSLEVVLLDMVGEENGNLPAQEGQYGRLVPGKRNLTETYLG